MYREDIQCKNPYGAILSSLSYSHNSRWRPRGLPSLLHLTVLGQYLATSHVFWPEIVHNHYSMYHMVKKLHFHASCTSILRNNHGVQDGRQKLKNDFLSQISDFYRNKTFQVMYKKGFLFKNPSGAILSPLCHMQNSI